MKKTAPKKSGQKFAALLESRQMAPSELAKILNESLQVVNGWKQRGVSSWRAIEVASILNCDPTEISSVKGKNAIYKIKDDTAEYRAIPQTKTFQIIRWEDIANRPDGAISITGRPAFTWRACGERSFGIRMEGNSMEPPTPQKLYAPDGCLLIADPDAGSSPFNWVIVQPNNYPTPICRKLVIEGGKMLLIPLNPQYPIIDGTENCRIIAHVVDIDLLPET